MTDDFNPFALLESTIDEQMTERPAIPEGEYIGTIQPINEKSFTKGEYKQGDRAGQTWRGINMRLKVDLTQYPEVHQATGVPEVTLFHLVFIDLTEGGAWDTSKDKNKGIKKYREATGQNEAGQTWGLSMLNHQQVRVRVAHGTNKEGGVREEVTNVAGI